MTTAFFEDVLAEYLAEDRIDEAVLRLGLDDGRTRRLVVADGTEDLDPHEYLLRELAEVRRLVEENPDVFADPVELSIPVDDADRVIEEAREDGTVTTWVKPGGIGLLLDHLIAMTELDAEEGTDVASGGDADVASGGDAGDADDPGDVDDANDADDGTDADDTGGAEELDGRPSA